MILTYVAFILAIILTLLMGVPYIDFLKKKLYGQPIRDVAPKTHEKKGGTPTTGGVFIVISSILAALISLVMAEKTSNMSFIILITFIFYMLTGLMDDFTKITKKQNEGLTPRKKLLLQFAIASLPVFYMFMNGQTQLTYGDFYINLGWLYPIFALVLIVGMSNAVNLTDGLDGLAALNVAIVMLATIVINLTMGRIDLAIVSAAISGSCFGFLFFNKHPAKVFMGDTGSLALGGVLGAIAVIGKFELWLIPISFIFISETLSVMIQVFSFKAFGKRIFKMTPIHHHFELSGWKETTVVKVFSLITLILSTSSAILYWYLNR